MRRPDRPSRFPVSRSGRLSTLELALLAVLGPAAALAGGALLGLPGRFNDFSSYWLAGRLVASGVSPYDLASLAALGRSEGLHFLVGGGYSYPPPFAVLMVPLASLPFETAAWIFSLTSLVAFGIAAGLCLARLPGEVPVRLLRSLAVAAGAYPPVAASAFFGQANLLVTAALAIGLLLVLGSWDRAGSDERSPRLRLLGGALLGLAAVVKLVPLLLLGPLLLGRRWWPAAGLAAGAVLPLGLAALAAPVSGQGSGSLVGLFVADGFWSNQSLNGFATRLVAPTDRTTPLLPGLDPTLLGVALVALLGLVTVAILVARRGSMRDVRPGPGLAAGLAVLLVAGLAGAPKDSFWNHTPAVLAVGLLLPRALNRSPAAPRWTGPALVWIWYGAAWLQALLDAAEGGLTRPLGGLGAVASSTALLGLLALWTWSSLLLLRWPARPASDTEVADELSAA